VWCAASLVVIAIFAAALLADTRSDDDHDGGPDATA